MDPIQEAAEAIQGIHTVADLDKRAQVLKDRQAMGGGKLTPVLVPVPDHYSTQEAGWFKRLLRDELEKVISGVETEVAYLAVWPEQAKKRGLE